MTVLAGDLIPLPDLPAALLAFANPSDPLEVARCGYQAVWRRARNGSLPVHKFGRMLFVERGNLEGIAVNVLGLTGGAPRRSPKVPRARATKPALSTSAAAAA
jgi:hypothetical protein